MCTLEFAEVVLRSCLFIHGSRLFVCTLDLHKLCTMAGTRTRKQNRWLHLLLIEGLVQDTGLIERTTTDRGGFIGGLLLVKITGRKAYGTIPVGWNIERVPNSCSFRLQQCLPSYHTCRRWH